MDIKLDTFVIRFCQEGNTLGTTDSYEDLTIRLETQLPGEDPFVVIKSDSGWSVDSSQELVDLIDRVKKAAKDVMNNDRVDK